MSAQFDPDHLAQLAANPSPWMILRRGRQQLRQNRLAEARATFEALVAGHPEFTQARGWLGVAQAQAGLTRSALESLAPMVSSATAAPQMLNAYATMLCRARRWKALGAFLADRGDELDPRWVTAGGHRPLDRSFLTARRQFAADGQPPLAVYFHLPFSAGTSVTVGLDTVYGRALHVVARKFGQHTLAELDIEALHAARPPQVIRLHHPYPITTPPGTTWVTMLREPVPRFMSGFRKRLEPHRLPTLDFREEPSVEATIANAEFFRLHDPMARELAVLHPEVSALVRSVELRPRSIRFEEQLDFWRVTAGLSAERLYQLADEVLDEQFKVVGIAEQFDASYLAIGGVLGLEAMPEPAHTGRSDSAQHVPSPSQVERIERLHEVDSALYTRWRDRFAAQLAGAGPELSGARPA